jgi:hypothetical protein
MAVNQYIIWGTEDGTRHPQREIDALSYFQGSIHVKEDAAGAYIARQGGVLALGSRDDNWEIYGKSNCAAHFRGGGSAVRKGR